VKQLAGLVLVASLTGCAATQSTGLPYGFPSTYVQPAESVNVREAVKYESKPVEKIATVEDLEAMNRNLSSRDCPRIQQYVNYVDRQLALKGLQNANPEDLNMEDRRYNAAARIMVWGLRIGCNNPTRYKK